MAHIQPVQARKYRRSGFKRFSLSIGMRLFLAFLVLILFTGFIGLLAIQQIRALTDTAIELNVRDLPEAVLLEEVHGLLYQEQDLEHTLLNGDDTERSQTFILPRQSRPERMAVEPHGLPISSITLLNSASPFDSPPRFEQQPRRVGSELTNVLDEIQSRCQELLYFERGEYTGDYQLVQQLVATTRQANALSGRIQALVAQGQIAQARALDAAQQDPLLNSALATITRLITAEHAENTHDMAQTQLGSGQSMVIVLALTLLCLLLSLVLAILITRSLTRPLKALVRTTEAITAGDLDAKARVTRRDEIGRLALAYDRMRVSLRSTIASLSQERRQTQAIIDASADGIIVVDEAQKIVRGNPAAEQLCGWPIEEAIGRFCWEVLGLKESSDKEDKANEQLLALKEALQTRSELSHLELSITDRRGVQRWLMVSCSPMLLDEEDGEERYTVIGLHDISQLKAVDQMKTDFVAMVSHELRAPLTNVTGSVEILSQLDVTTERELYQEVVIILDQQTWRLRQVVEEVLQLTRFEAGRLDVRIRSLPIAPFLRNLVNIVNAEWNENDHFIVLHETDPNLLVWADGGLLEIVLRNLLGNARKYTPQGTAIEIETEMLRSAGQTQIRVRDHGPGIHEDQFERIFERFVRGSQPPGNWTRGYGLGLYIARELMLAQNGDIRAEKSQRGASFVLTLWNASEESPDLSTDTASDPVEC